MADKSLFGSLGGRRRGGRDLPLRLYGVHVAQALRNRSIEHPEPQIEALELIAAPRTRRHPYSHTMKEDASEVRVTDNSSHPAV